ncbi:MAG: hypothetical protein ACHQHN_17660 [Sphingobacteriales bacterium]
MLNFYKNRAGRNFQNGKRRHWRRQRISCASYSGASKNSITRPNARHDQAPLLLWCNWKEVWRI